MFGFTKLHHRRARILRALAALLVLPMWLAEPSWAQSARLHVSPQPTFLGSAEYPMSPSSVRQWVSMAARARAEAAQVTACDRDPAVCASAKVRAWREALGELRGAPPSVQIDRINRHVNNAIRYRPDADDHWATPLEALARGGDCEDYAIMKYFSLLELGYRDSQMRIVVVHDDSRRIGHAVLTVIVNGSTFVLDSLRSGVGSATQLAGYSPRYYVNAGRAALLLPTAPQRARLATR